jgi:hypothetical protein
MDISREPIGVLRTCSECTLGKDIILGIGGCKLIQFACNQHDHSSIGMNPFHALYGQECQTPITLAPPNSKIESLNQMIQEMHDVLEYAKQCM